MGHLAGHEEAGVDVHVAAVPDHHHRPALGEQPQVTVRGETGSGTLACDSKAIQSLEH